MTSRLPDHHHDTAALLKANRRGILLMSGGMALFVINDALVKFVSQSLPVTQLIFLRGVMATALVLMVARHMGAFAHLRQAARPAVVVRALVDAVASMVYLVSLAHLPLANATAINLASPLFITVLAVLLLGERVSAARWLATLVGFAGVLMVIQPRGEGFNGYALLCLCATVLHAARDLLTRRIAPGISSILITLSTAIAVTLMAGVVSLFVGWRPFDAGQICLLALASVFLAAGYYCIISCVRHGELSLIAPFRYAGLLCALVIGFAVWGDVPNALAWAGIALLVGAGLHMIHGERVRARAASDPQRG